MKIVIILFYKGGPIVFWPLFHVFKTKGKSQ